MNNLKFLRTIPVYLFKAEQGIDKLDILKNETSDKHFFAWEGGKGAVSSKYPNEPLSEPMVSKVQVEDSDEEPFYLLHNKGESKVSVVASL